MVHTITALKAQKRNPNRINVYLDGEFGFGLSRIVAAWLSVGQSISDEKIVTLKTDDELEVAYQSALKYIGYRMRSSNEVEQYLLDKGTSQETIGSALERLKQSGLVNDNLFARTWTDNRVEFRPRSRRVVKSELRFKGISDEVIENTLNEMPPEEDLAYQAGVKYARKLSDSDRFEFSRRLSGFLARRGFSYDVIKPVSARLWDEREMENSNEYNIPREEDEEER